MKRFALVVCSCLLFASLIGLAPSVLHVEAQTYTLTQISAVKLYDSARQPLNGTIVVTLTDNTDTPVTYTPQGGSPSTATFTANVTNGVIQLIAGNLPFTVPAAATTSPSGIVYRIQTYDRSSNNIWTFPKTPINQQYYSVDGYIAQAAQPISGYGAPSVPRCAGGAQYTDTSASSVPWACTIITTPDNSTVWTQNPSLAAQCPGQAIAYPLIGNPYCLGAAQAFLLPGYVLGNDGATPSMPHPIVRPSGGGATPAPPAFAVQFANGSASNLQADPVITIDPTQHIFDVGTGQTAGAFTVNGGCIGTCATLTSADGITWSMGTNLAIQGNLSLGTGANVLIPGCTGKVVAADGTGCVSAGGPPAGSVNQAQVNNGSGSLGFSPVTMDSSGNVTTSGAVAASTASASVNTQINVMAPPYNAKGDCSTDDFTAITAAMTAAMATARPKSLYFPTPPGGCYLTSTLTWHGLSMECQVSGIANGAGTGPSCELRSKPGQDLWWFPDPADTTTTLASKSPLIHSMMFTTDDSVDASASHPYRKPGRYVTDGVTTSGSATISSAHGNCHAADVWQQIGITYPDNSTQTGTMTSCATSQGQPGTSFTVAGSTPLATATATLTPLSNVITVSSVTGTISVGNIALVGGFSTLSVVTVTAVSGSTVTLSASNLCFSNCSETVHAAFYDPTFTASETQTSVQLYFSILNLPVTATFGNCAIAFDNRNGSTSTSNYLALSGAVFRDVQFRALSNSQQNNSCAIYAQGQVGTPYATRFEHVHAQGFVWGFAMAMPYAITPFSGGAGGDYNVWTDMEFGDTYPFIYYNGGEGHISQIEFGSAHGPQILAAYNSVEQQPIEWTISIPEMEQQTATNQGFTLEGYNHTVQNLQIGDGGAPTHWDANNSRCVGCPNRAGVLLMGGIRNDIDINNSVNFLTVADDPNNGNTVTGDSFTSAVGGQQPKRRIALNNMRQSVAAAVTEDFVHGSSKAPFMNKGDLMLWPSAMLWGSGSNTVIVNDPTVMTGSYRQITVNGAWITGSTDNQPNTRLTIGGNRPNLSAKQYQIEIRAKCPVLTSFTVTPSAMLPAGTTDHSFGATTVPCSTTWATAKITVDLSPYTGDWVQVAFGNGGSGEIDLGWLAFDPFQEDFNGFQPALLNANTNTTVSNSVIPAPGGGTNTNLGGVQANSCTGGAIKSINGDGTSTCITVSTGITQNAIHAPTLDSTGASINNIINVTTANDGSMHDYQLCGYIDVTVAATGGTSPTFMITGSYTSDGHSFANGGVTPTVSALTQWANTAGSSSTNGTPCIHFSADPNTTISAKVALGGTMGTPGTIRYSATLYQLQ